MPSFNYFKQNFMEFKTKFNPNDVAYGVQENKIVKAIIVDVNADENASTGAHVTNTDDQSRSWDDDHLFGTPQEVGDALVAEYEAANPAAEETAVPASEA